MPILSFNALVQSFLKIKIVQNMPPIFHTGQRFNLMQPKFPSTFSASYISEISIAMPIYTQKLKITKDFGSNPKFYP